MKLITGVHTLIKIHPLLAFSYSMVMDIQRTLGDIAIGKEIVMGQKLIGTQSMVIDGGMVFAGEDIPFKTDFDQVKAGVRNVYHANGYFNLVGEIPIEEVRVFIEQNNLNMGTNLGHLIYKGVPVFPELATDRVLELTNFPVANAAGV